MRVRSATKPMNSMCFGSRQILFILLMSRFGGGNGEANFGAADIFEAVEDADGKRMFADRQYRDAEVVALDGRIANAGAGRDENPITTVETILRAFNRGSG